MTWKKKPGESEQHAAGLNLEPDYEVAADEQLVLLTRGLPVTYSAPGKPPETRDYGDSGAAPTVPARVLLIGWTDILYDILQELDAHALSGTGVTILSAVGEPEAKERLAAHQGGDFKNLNLVFLQGDAVSRVAYAALERATFESVVVLAEDSDNEGDADTRSLRILLRLSDLRRHDDWHTHTVVELLDDNNRALFAGLGVDDIVVSPEVVSAQLAQIARQEVLAPIYRELLSAGGVEISLRPTGDYVEPDTECSFGDLVYASQQKMETALCLRLARQGGEVLLNPSRQVTWRLGENDKVIVLAQQVYR